MPSSGMLRRVAPVGTEVSEERSANVVLTSPILVSLMIEELRSSEMSVTPRVTRRNIREDGMLHCFS
jgi:hypothetical protein